MQTPTTRPAVHLSHSRQLLNLGSGIAVLAILAIVGYLLLRERHSVEQSAMRASNNLLHLIESDILGTVERYDQSLRGLIWASRQPAVMALPPRVRHQWLFEQALARPLQGDILWLDAQGAVVEDSRRVAPRAGNLAHAALFRQHRDDPALGLIVGMPFQGHLDDRHRYLSLSRRIDDRAGAFAGVASGALRLSYFDQLFARLDIGASGSVSLFDLQGHLIAHHPMSPPHPPFDGDFSMRAVFERVLEQRRGTFASTSSFTGVKRVYSFSQVGDLPLLLVLAQASDDILQSWWRTVLLIGSATGGLCAGLLWLTWLLGRELRRRHAAEQVLASLASTDSLTGLANRRHLDHMLRLESARARRSGRPLAVLMIDIDHFKAFNQRHGHAGGDRALQEVAKAIERSLHRPADLAARYGGEEFQVVLPETERGSALRVAERIRASVEALPLFSDDSRPVTVSIGVGFQLPGKHQTLPQLLGDADRALYKAKADGRNRVEGL
ncbi:GGDEF domain-containing protein [Pseudomonas entomophila]|uniref:GGDEF domain-containing protein n=1 Tax=Pseudomonas entomophila TaxID=312306 RepID=UPI0015E31AE7|nr:sensor domain-containing diguanylate cyclase [Pseudomonas entomophila]MBA1188921.1 GGDEF domain-containing protein [Pseudomonas entomophila]